MCAHVFDLKNYVYLRFSNKDIAETKYVSAGGLSVTQFCVFYYPFSPICCVNALNGGVVTVL